MPKHRPLHDEDWEEQINIEALVPWNRIAYFLTSSCVLLALLTTLKSISVELNIRTYVHVYFWFQFPGYEELHGRLIRPPFCFALLGLSNF